VVVVAAGEEGLSAEHLCEDTADAPHVDGAGVLFECEHDLGGAVPAGCDVFGHEGGAVVGDVWRGTGGAGEAEIAELVVVNEDICNEQMKRP
jgi:hypothetical protein